jgi:hypothetical protein
MDGGYPIFKLMTTPGQRRRSPRPVHSGEQIPVLKALLLTRMDTRQSVDERGAVRGELTKDGGRIVTAHEVGVSRGGLLTPASNRRTSGQPCAWRSTSSRRGKATAAPDMGIAGAGGGSSLPHLFLSRRLIQWWQSRTAKIFQDVRGTVAADT